MKKLSMIIILALTLLTACANHKELAQEYKLELQYYNNAIKFADINMTEEAAVSCNRTIMLRSECFTSIVQEFIGKEAILPKYYCDAIHPEEKMQMTKKAFGLVYKEMDADLEEELSQKLSPSKQRISALSNIKEECYTKAR